MKKLLLIAIIGFVSLGFKCNKSSGGGIDVPESSIFRGRLYDDKRFVTAAFATVEAKDTIDPAVGPLIDGGFADVNRIASQPPNNYDVSDLPASRYKVWFYPRSRYCETAAFLVDATNSPYEGSQWDKDPSPTRCLLCAAGMTIMQGIPITGPGMLITDDKGIMRTIVRYEAEHSILFYKDPQRYNETQYHAQGQGHPILGEGRDPELRSLSGPSLEAVTADLPVDVVVGGSSDNLLDTPRIVATKGTKACVLLTK